MNSRQAEIPREVRPGEGGDKAATGSVDVERDVPAVLGVQVHKGVVQFAYRFVLARVGAAEDAHYADGVLVDQRHGLIDADYVTLRCKGHIPGLDVQVAGEFLPANLDIRPEDDVRPVGCAPLCAGAHANAT